MQPTTTCVRSRPHRAVAHNSPPRVVREGPSPSSDTLASARAGRLGAGCPRVTRLCDDATCRASAGTRPGGPCTLDTSSTCAGTAAGPGSTGGDPERDRSASAATPRLTRSPDTEMDSPAAMSAPEKGMASPAGGLEQDAIGVLEDTVIGMASSAPAVSVAFTMAALGGGHELRQRTDHRHHGRADARHRVRLPTPQPVESELRRLVRVGRPRDRPVSRLHGRLVDGGRLRHRHGERCRGARSLGAGGLRRQRRERLGECRHRHRRRTRDAAPRRRRYPHHGPHPDRLRHRGVHDPRRFCDRRPRSRRQPLVRHLPHDEPAGSARAASAARGAPRPGS